MELFGKKLTLNETITFVRRIGANRGFTGCSTEKCLVSQAARDLADEVERLRKKYETENEPVLNQEDGRLYCPNCGKEVGHLVLQVEPSNYCPDCGTCFHVPKE